MDCLILAIDAVAFASGYLVVEFGREAMLKVFRLSVEAVVAPMVGENSRD